MIAFLFGYLTDEKKDARKTTRQNSIQTTNYDCLLRPGRVVTILQLVAAAHPLPNL
jgi:hypothetical protein